MGFFSNIFGGKDTKDNEQFDEFESELGVDPYEFEIIVYSISKQFKRLKIQSIVGGKINCSVQTNSGISDWNFSVDFRYNQKIYKDYYIHSENLESALPEKFANKVSQQLTVAHQNLRDSSSRNINDVYCSHCGAINDKDSLYCIQCGNKMLILEEKIIELKIAKEKTRQEQIQFEREQSIKILELETEKSKQMEMQREKSIRTQRTLVVFSKILIPSLTFLICFTVITQHNYKKQLKLQEQRIELKHIKNGDIKIPFSNYDFKNTEYNKDNPIKYKSVKEDFKNAGFKNIKLVKQPDVGFGGGSVLGNVVSVTINGDNDFEEGEWFPKNSKIKIVYRVKK